MAADPRYRSLLDYDTLVMQQVTAFMANDFQIFDLTGAPIGLINTTGAASDRLDRSRFGGHW